MGMVRILRPDWQGGTNIDGMPCANDAVITSIIIIILGKDTVRKDPRPPFFSTIRLLSTPFIRLRSPLRSSSIYPQSHLHQMRSSWTLLS